MAVLRPKRVAAIHDISSFGRCALSVIIPTLSAMQVQVCPIPTAVLSTHTGGFTDIAVQECADFPDIAAKHLKKCGVELDCIYSGYLGTAAQTEQIIQFKTDYPDALLVVDPVLGDDGMLYSGITASHVDAMKKLTKHAGLITPNATEASLLLGQAVSTPICRADAKDMLKALGNDHKTDVIITGMDMDEHGKCNLIGHMDELYLIPCKHFSCSYPGTGDIFTSVVLGCIMDGCTLSEAALCATEFTELCISLTIDSSEPTRDGVFLEYALPQLNKLNYNREIIIL